MRIFLTLSLVFTMGLIADHHEETKYKYEPEANKAEYYIGTFKKGKDMEDLVKWHDKTVDWMSDSSSAPPPPVIHPSNPANCSDGLGHVLTHTTS